MFEGEWMNFRRLYLKKKDVVESFEKTTKHYTHIYTRKINVPRNRGTEQSKEAGFFYVVNI